MYLVATRRCAALKAEEDVALLPVPAERALGERRRRNRGVLVVLSKGDADREAKSDIVARSDLTAHLRPRIRGPRVALAGAVFEVEQGVLLRLPVWHIVQQHRQGRAIGPDQLEPVCEEAEVLRLYARSCAPQILIEFPATPRLLSDDGRKADGDGLCRLGRPVHRLVAAEAEKQAGKEAEPSEEA